MELQRNCSYFKVDTNLPWPLEFFDLQKLYSRSFSDGKTRVALETAVTEREIEKDIPFHSAFADALYTSRVMRCMDFDKVKQFTSIDTYRIPTTKKEEFTMDYGEYTKYISRGFADKDQAMKDGKLLVSICPVCKKSIRKKIRWFAVNQKNYYAVASCAEHGLVKDKPQKRLLKLKSVKISNALKDVNVARRIKTIKNIDFWRHDLKSASSFLLK